MTQMMASQKIRDMSFVMRNLFVLDPQYTSGWSDMASALIYASMEVGMPVLEGRVPGNAPSVGRHALRIIFSDEVFQAAVGEARAYRAAADLRSEARNAGRHGCDPQVPAQS